jgi:hypothetical protein
MSGSTEAPPPHIGRRDSEPRGTWQHWSPLELGGRVRTCGTRGSTRAFPSCEVRFGAAESVVAPEPSRARRQGLELWATWWYAVACPTLCLDLDLVSGGTWFAGYRQWPPGPPWGRLRARGWGQIFGTALNYFEFFAWQLKW